MSGTERAATGVPALPRARVRPTSPGSLRVPPPSVLEAAGGLARADDAHEAAQSALLPLVRLPGVRAGLVVRAPRPGADPVVLASSGYDCADMAVGARLPLDAGLPVTECVRTGRTRVTGAGPAWVAVPAGPASALLLSLLVPAPEGAALASLERVGDLLAGALARTARADDARARLDVLETGLSAARCTDGAVVRAVPFSGELSGDVVTLVDDGPGVRWLLLADVCGRGADAALPAERLRAAFTACAPGSSGPVEVLARLDRVVQAGEEGFATALVARLAEGEVRLASAGHPAPLLAPGGRVALVPGAPLGLGLPDGDRPVEQVVVVPGPVLLVGATDGLTDRGAEVDLDALVAALPPDRGAGDVADRLLARCLAAGPAQDDATLVVVPLGRPA